ncbi:MAG: hypothetical protein Q8Q67_02535 [bacterium]|nr:hypothetical protein [bacterium]
MPSVFQEAPEADYFFTYIPSVWGWATWKRSWDKYDFHLTTFDEYDKSRDIEKIFPKRSHQKYWLNYFYEIKNRKINNWDYQLAYTSFKNKGLCIRPRVNLVQNLGMTLTNGKSKTLECSYPLTITTHPDIARPDRSADLAIMKALTAPLHQFKFFLKKVGLFYILKKIYKKL